MRGDPASNALLRRAKMQRELAVQAKADQLLKANPNLKTNQAKAMAERLVPLARTPK